MTTDAGSTVHWRPGDVPTGDARPTAVVGGRVIGALTGTSTFTVKAPGEHIAAKRVSIVLGQRTVAGPEVTSTARPATAAPTPARVSAFLKPDPGVKGHYRTSEFSYARPSVKLPGYSVGLEMKAEVVQPVGAKGRRPLVLFLHGRHGTCYGGESDGDLGWPCPKGSSSIPSYLGYLQAQRLLASQGFVTVSISANSINAQDGDQQDSGAEARSFLVRQHLALLTQWTNGAGPASAARTALKGKIDPKRIITVGHSRGGEGVVRAAIDAQKSDPFRIIGQVLIAPTDFGEQVAVGIPTEVLLPYCDGDVSDLQGQQYVDEGRLLASGDNALKSSVLVMGANHNYFNSVWTPGGSKAPAFDDWGGDASDSCSPSRSTRLKPAQQRAVGATYIAAAARTFTAADRTSIRLLDGSAVRAGSAGAATVYSSSLGGHRAPLLIPATKVPAVSGGMTGSICGPTSASKKTCAGAGSSPHWLSWGQFSGPRPTALQLRWSTAGARVRLSNGFSGPRSAIDVRAIGTAGSQVLLRVRDTAGHAVSIRPQRGLDTFAVSGGARRGWAQDLRFALPRKGLDRAHVARVDLVGDSKSGSATVLDAWATNDGLALSSASVLTVPKLSVNDVTVTADPHNAAQTANVTMSVLNHSAHAARFWAQRADDYSPSPSTGSIITVPAGASSVNFAITFSGDDVLGNQRQETVMVRALQGGVVDGYVGGLTIKSGLPPVTLTADNTTAVTTPGGSLRWILTTSRPVGNYSEVTPRAMPTSPQPELTLAALYPSVLADLGLSGTPVTTTLSGAGLSLSSHELDPGESTVVVELPIRPGAQLDGPRHVKVGVVVSGVNDGAPLILTGVVNPAG